MSTTKKSNTFKSINYGVKYSHVRFTHTLIMWWSHILQKFTHHTPGQRMIKFSQAVHCHICESVISHMHHVIHMRLHTLHIWTTYTCLEFPEWKINLPQHISHLNFCRPVSQGMFFPRLSLALAMLSFIQRQNIYLGRKKYCGENVHKNQNKQKSKSK